MRITEVNIPQKFYNNGVDDIIMRRLENIVLIAGKNGSGKSRILDKIRRALENKPKRSFKNKNEELYNQAISELAILEAKIEDIDNSIHNSNNNIAQLNANQQKYNESKSLHQLRKQIIESKPVVEWNLIITDEELENYDCVPFIPTNLNLIDSSTYSKKDLIAFAENVNQMGMDILAEGTFAKIQAVQDRWFHATHPNTGMKDLEKKESIKEYEILCNLISIFLQTNLERSSDGEAMIFGFNLGDSKLSHGQRVLIQLCIALYSQNRVLKNLILFLDEPENHLHPSAIIDMITRLQEATKDCQIWISTHSVPLLAHFDPKLIWYVQEGKISYAGNIPEKVLNGLLGDDTELCRLQDFINLPAQFALTRYAFECLFTPAAVMTKPDDPQSIQINEELKSIVKSERIKILDYGAGKGRLLSSLYEYFGQNLEAINDKFEYVAYDEYDHDKLQCQSIISNVYSQPNNHYFNDMKGLLTSHDPESFDVIIMCNVLHEIDPKDWIKLFKTEGTLTKLLKVTGVLILVEDTLMPIGEKAYQKGFIVLDTPEIKQLFKIPTSNNQGFKYSKKNGDRLKLHTIPKTFLENISPQTRILSLKSLKENARNNILKIRSEKHSYTKGKEHAFWVQQFANTSLSLSELDGD